MAFNNIEITLQDKGMGGGNSLKLFPIYSTSSRIRICVMTRDSRADDADERVVNTYGLDVDLEELRNAIVLMEGSAYESTEDQAPCKGCGRT